METTKKPNEELGRLIHFQRDSQSEKIETGLEYIYKHLLTELENKRNVNNQLRRRIRDLDNQLKNYKQQANLKNTEIENEKKQHEGTRQLISKLLNDIKKYQNDIEWYKRTYETRSLLGTIKEKVLGRKASS